MTSTLKEALFPTHYLDDPAITSYVTLFLLGITSRLVVRHCAEDSFAFFKYFFSLVNVQLIFDEVDKLIF